MTEGATYQIRVQGWVGERWSGYLNGMTIVRESAPDGTPVTILTGTVPDQAALRGALNQLWDLNLTLISVHKQGSPPVKCCLPQSSPRRRKDRQGDAKTSETFAYLAPLR
jgi:hypothetical protein